MAGNRLQEHVLVRQMEKKSDDRATYLKVALNAAEEAGKVTSFSQISVWTLLYVHYVAHVTLYTQQSNEWIKEILKFF